MDSGNQSWRPPYESGYDRPRMKNLRDSPFFKTIFSITFGIALIFFIISIYVIFSPSNSSYFTEPSPVYFFVLIFNTPIFPVGTLWVAVVMVVLYMIFFSAMLYMGISQRKGPLLDNPVLYYGGMASFGYLLSLLISIIEMALGVQIGGASLEAGLQQHPYLSFIQFIYAPFAEELGFRIIPLGLFSAYLVSRARSTSGTTARDAVLSFLIPGIIRKKYGISLTKGDYVLVAATSILFGLAHFLYGAWDPGKIISAAAVGVILAFGFLKFGFFVDIPIHWFFNGFSTLYVVYPPMTTSWIVALLWTLFSGLVAFIFLFVLFSNRKQNKGSLGFSPDSLS